MLCSRPQADDMATCGKKGLPLIIMETGLLNINGAEMTVDKCTRSQKMAVKIVFMPKQFKILLGQAVLSDVFFVEP